MSTNTPWSVPHKQEAECTLANFYRVDGADGVPVAYAPYRDDATLIAAAPRLRDALHTSSALITSLCKHYGIKDDFEMEAVTKETGESRKLMFSDFLNEMTALMKEVKS